MNTSDNNPTLCSKCGSPIPEKAPAGLCPACILTDSKSAPPEPSAPEIDDIQKAFPELEFITLIGRGGMGAVYHARQTKLDREIALKVLLPNLSTDAAFAERFEREARALAKLNHPNIVSVYDFGEREDLYYLAMEYVDGVNLRQAMAAGRFTPEQALQVIPGICDALQAAHDLEILHRDVKPENILLDQSGKVKIVDFGIARFVGDSSNFTLTETDTLLGTRPYMAPEQLESNKVDHRADIYSLGVVFYEMLTGELPIGRFLPPSQKVQAHQDIDAIVMRALEKELDRRFQSADDVKTEIQGAQRPRPSAPEEKSPDTPTGKPQRGKLAFFIGGLAILVSACFFSVFASSVLIGYGTKTPADFGKGVVFLAMILAAIPTYVVTRLLVSWLRFRFTSQRKLSWTWRFLGVYMAAIGIFAATKDGRWPYAHDKAEAYITIPNAGNLKRGVLNDAVEEAASSYKYSYYINQIDNRVFVRVLHKHTDGQAEEHIKAFQLRLLDSLPAKTIVDTELKFIEQKPRLRFVFSVGLLGFSLLAAIAAIGIAFTPNPASIIGIVSMVAAFGIMIAVPSLRYPRHAPYLIDKPPLDSFPFPEYEPDFSTPEAAATTFMEASIRKDTAVMRQCFTSDWDELAKSNRIAETMDSFYETSRVLGVSDVDTRIDGLVGVTVEVIRRDGAGKGSLRTWFTQEDRQWKLAVPR